MKISVITVSFNSEKTIEKTIQSVLNQTVKCFEYIIIDGASSDNTLKVVNKYKDQMTKIISEPDQGLYDAMNKGIKTATGDYLLFLNSDDQLYDNFVFEKISSSIKNNKPDLIYGDICHNNETKNTRSIQKHNKFNKIYLIKNTPVQPTTFYKREVFETVGQFSTDFKIVSDHEWFLKAFLKNKIKALYVPITVNIFNEGGMSTNLKYEEKISKERQKMFFLYFGKNEFKFYSFISKYLRSLTTLPFIKTFFKV